MTTTAPWGAGTGIDVHLRRVVHLYPSAGGDVVALEGIDLGVAAGGSVALLGPSGAGKSTVLSLLAGNFVASAGQVEVGGEDIGRMDGPRLARLRAFDVSLVVQGAERNLLPYATASENVWFAQQGARRRGRALPGTARELLDAFGLAAIADTPVGRLPAGAQQGVALVAGIAPQPSLLLLDEPTSRLGPVERDRIVALILRICAELGTTVIMVTHDPAVAAALGRTVTIRDGRVGTEGRQGVEHIKVGRTGLVQLPVEALDVLPPDSLIEVIRHADHVELRPTRDQP